MYYYNAEIIADEPFEQFDQDLPLAWKYGPRLHHDKEQWPVYPIFLTTRKY